MNPPASSCIRETNPKPARSCRGHRGFSLLEVLLAVALATMLLVTVNFFVLSMGELWGGGAEERLFDRHVRGVTRFLESLVQQSVVLESDTTDGAATGSPRQAHATPARRSEGPLALGVAAPARGFARWRGAAVRWLGRASEPLAARASQWHGFALLGARGFQLQVAPDRGGSGRLPPAVRGADADHPPVREPARAAAATNGVGAATGPRFRLGTPHGYEGAAPMLIFEVDEAPGQCVWPQRPLPQVECALQANADEGLVLLWQSKLEDEYGRVRPRKTALSPFARRISFDYYDSERNTWTHSEQPQADGQGSWRVPQRIRVTFAYRNTEREVSIALPEAPGGAPLR